jgi:hypothetical protein
MARDRNCHTLHRFTRTAANVKGSAMLKTEQSGTPKCKQRGRQ